MVGIVAGFFLAVFLILDISIEYDTNLLFLFKTRATKVAIKCILPRMGVDGVFIQNTHDHYDGI